MSDRDREPGAEVRWTRGVAVLAVVLSVVLTAAGITIDRSSLQWVPGIVVAAVVGGCSSPSDRAIPSPGSCWRVPRSVPWLRSAWPSSTWTALRQLACGSRGSQTRSWS